MSAERGRRKRILVTLCRRESGALTVAAVGCVALVAVLALLTADVGMYLSARGRAKDAADAAALSALQESFPLFSTGVGPQAAAARFARLNGATAKEVRVSGNGERVEVLV